MPIKVPMAKEMAKGPPDQDALIVDLLNGLKLDSESIALQPDVLKNADCLKKLVESSNSDFQQRGIEDVVDGRLTHGQDTGHQRQVIYRPEYLRDGPLCSPKQLKDEVNYIQQLHHQQQHHQQQHYQQLHHQQQHHHQQHHQQVNTIPLTPSYQQSASHPHSTCTGSYTSNEFHQQYHMPGNAQYLVENTFLEPVPQSSSELSKYQPTLSDSEALELALALSLPSADLDTDGAPESPRNFSVSVATIGSLLPQLPGDTPHDNRRKRPPLGDQVSEVPQNKSPKSDHQETQPSQTYLPSSSSGVSTQQSVAWTALASDTSHWANTSQSACMPLYVQQPGWESVNTDVTYTNTGIKTTSSAQDLPTLACPNDYDSSENPGKFFPTQIQVAQPHADGVPDVTSIVQNPSTEHGIYDGHGKTNGKELPEVISDVDIPSPMSSVEADDKNTLLHYLMDRPQKELQEFLQKHSDMVLGDLNTTNNLLQTPLYVAVMTKNLVAVELLVGLGADLTLQGREEKRDTMQGPLHKAVELCDLRMVNLLIWSQCKEKAINQPRALDRKTPLMMAVHGHNPQSGEADQQLLVIRMLVERGGAAVDMLDERSNKTVLMMAIETRDLTLVEYLLKHVGEGRARELINRPNHARNTSLHIAAGLTQMMLADHLDLLNMLVYFGANTDAVNLDNQTPKDWKKNLFDQLKCVVPYKPDCED